MAKLTYSATVAALVFAACSDEVCAANSAEKPTPRASRMAALVTLEKSAYEAWKSKDAKFWDAFLSDKFIGYGSAGRLDKASATKEYTGTDCDIKSYALSDQKMRPLGNGATLLTYKEAVDGTCAGQKFPGLSWAASVYVRDGGKWRGVFHAAAAIVDPSAAPAAPTANRPASGAERAKPTAADARTDAMLAAEKLVWEAWRAHDAAKIAALTAADISFINIFGTYLPTKADALRNWSGVGCDAKSVSVSDAVGTFLSPTVGILTFRGGADGTCYGQTVGPVWGSSIYVRDGNAWKWVFGINVPARW